MLLASWAAASSPSVEDQDIADAVRQLDTGDWNARMRAVHELEYAEEAGIPALTIAAVDGDWQVRMAAVHALGPLGPKTEPILAAIMKHEPCPLVRLIALHNLGSRAAEGAEEKAIDWMFSASSAQINDCRDQPQPGRAPWASNLGRQAQAPAPAPAAQAAAPTKNERYAELDALLADASGPPETLGEASKISRRPAPAPPVKIALETPPRPNANAELTARRTGKPETLPRPVVTTPAPERPLAATGVFEAAGSKAPHDALPELLLALKNGGVKTRSRAADELGSSGAAAASAVPALLAALKDPNARVRASAGLALGNIGSVDGRVVPLLVKALKDKNPDVRYAALLALSRIETPAAREAFKKHLGEDARRAIERQ